MGKVAIGFEVMPEGVDVDLSEIKKSIESKIQGFCSIQNIEVKPIAFGLKALMLTVVVEDEEGVMDRLEENIGSIPGVQSTNVVNLTKL